ncbi:MAG: tagaturonate reductase, partial [Spirochaetaceae bacterium]|nr:tagaturonate reductase [Spirochaetaceae bacterium]
ERFKSYPQGKLVIIPCELIDDNGQKLKEIVLRHATEWKLEPAFLSWLEENTWCDSLVDRIVPGFPFDEKEALWQKLGYQDNFMVTGEYFHLFVIKGPAWLKDELKLEGSGLNVIVTDNIKPYKQQKVGILNGGHTMMVPIAYLAGLLTVREAVEDAQVGEFLNKALQTAVIPALPLPQETLENYAGDVLKRFKNPYIKHNVLSITLNHFPKFKERVWYTTIEPYYAKHGKWPMMPLFSLAAAIRFYKGELNGQPIELKDDAYIIEAAKAAWAKFDGYKGVVQSFMRLEKLWGKDLSLNNEVVEIVANYLEAIDKTGMREALKWGLENK